MNKSNKILMIAVLFFSIAANAITPKEIINTISEKSQLTMDKQKGDESRKSIREFIDFDVLARDSLGKQWQKISAKDKSEFKNTLQEIIERTVFPKSPEFFKNTKIEVKEEKLETSKGYLKANVEQKEKSATVELWLQKAKADEWKIVDLAIEEERWVNNLKDQFEEVIKQKSFPELLKKMKKRLSDLKAKKEY